MSSSTFRCSQERCGGGGESELNDNHRIIKIMWCKAMCPPVEEGPVGSGPRIVTAAAVKAMSSGL